MSSLRYREASVGTERERERERDRDRDRETERAEQIRSIIGGFSYRRVLGL